MTARNVAPNPEVRRVIELGLEKYRRGELREAIEEWEGVLRSEPDNGEAQNLIKFARQMMPSELIKPGSRPTDPWPAEEKTEPESEQETRQRVLRAESEAALVQASERVRRVKMTIESPISAFLAPLTSPAWTSTSTSTPKRGKAQGSAPSGPGAMASDTVRASASDAARLRAAEMVSRCRAELENGQGEAAAAAAEGALAEADRNGADADADADMADVLEEAEPILEQAFLAHLGTLQRVPLVIDAKAKKIQTGKMALSSPENRKAILSLLATVDGLANLGQILDQSPVPRLQTLRCLSALVRGKAIKFL
jgi:hypothetical protein